ncbi:MAG TPA: transcriptional repressor [Acidimicrobiaceae bacterium]|nr:transcriptional repressor [Acidimicrobiaceae bacterium]
MIGGVSSAGSSAAEEPGVPHEAVAVEHALDLLRGAGGRITTSRRLLVEALFASSGHRTAEELAAVVQTGAPDVHLSTVYRNLDELERLGIVVHAHLGHGPATYHLAARTHAHLVCEVCQATIEAPDEMFSHLSAAARARFGFAIDPHHFAVLGRCRSCAEETVAAVSARAVPAG